MRKEIKERVKEKLSEIRSDGKPAFRAISAFIVRRLVRATSPEEQQEWTVIRRLLWEHFAGFSKESFLRDLETL